VIIVGAEDGRHITGYATQGQALAEFDSQRGADHTERELGWLADNGYLTVRDDWGRQITIGRNEC